MVYKTLTTIYCFSNYITYNPHLVTYMDKESTASSFRITKCKLFKCFYIKFKLKRYFIYI